MAAANYANRPRSQSQQKRSLLQRRDPTQTHKLTSYDEPQAIKPEVAAHHWQKHRVRETIEAAESISRASPSNSGSGTPGSPVELEVSEPTTLPTQPAPSRYTAQELITIDDDEPPIVAFPRGTKHPRLQSSSSLERASKTQKISQEPRRLADTSEHFILEPVDRSRPMSREGFTNQ